MDKVLILLLLLTFVGLTGFKETDSSSNSATSEVEVVSLEQRYEQARNKVRKNCFTCMGATKEALEEGVLDLERVIEEGVQTLDAYLWLARSYRSLAVEDSNPDTDLLLAKEYEIYKKLIKTNPDNYEVFSGYVTNLSVDEMIVEYKKFILRNPNNADAHSALYRIYASGVSPDWSIAVSELKKAFRLAKYEKAWNYGRELHSLLIQLGLTEEAKQVAKQVEEVRKSL